MHSLNKLQELINEAQDALNELSKEWNMALDSANFQTKSKEDFEKYVNEFESEGLKFLIELSHAGRKINVYQVPDKLKENYFGLGFVEVSEPKPGKNIINSDWEFVSFVVPDYDGFLEATSSDRTLLTKIRIVGNTKVAYYAPLSSRVQFRNKSISEADGEEETVQEGTENMEADVSVISEDEAMTNVEDNALLNREKEARLRLMADFDNYRKTTEKRIESMQQAAMKRQMLKLIEIIDDVERAMEKEKGADGFRHILDKLMNFLAGEDVVVIDVKKGAKFDHSVMEAVTTVKAKGDRDDNTVYDVLQKGYKFGSSDQVVRMARVVVAKA